MHVSCWKPTIIWRGPIQYFGSPSWLSRIVLRLLPQKSPVWVRNVTNFFAFSWDNEKHFRKAQRATVWRNLCVQFFAAFRRISQIGQRRPGLPKITWYDAMFDPSIVLISCQALFLLSGALSAFMLCLIKKQFERFRKVWEKRGYKDVRECLGLRIPSL